MIRKSLLELIHGSAHIQRWNDHIRPSGGFTELDKQAHKMIVAFVLAKFEEDDTKAQIDWRYMIEGGFFEFLHRIVLTDIKPPVFYELMKTHGQQLNAYVLDQLASKVDGIDAGFSSRMAAYFADDRPCLEKQLLKAAHSLATNWEFQIIYKLNADIYGVEEIKTRIESELQQFNNLAGVKSINLHKETSYFLDLVGQLRFQQRWAQSPRVPATSVMGHMLIVALLAYLCSREMDVCDRRLCNNYFAGLFHDLPEVLTRDIISPVKSSVSGLDELIKQIESRQVDEKIFPLVPASWHKELRYFMEDEFRNKILVDDKVQFVTTEQLSSQYDQAKYSPVDGEMIKGCDQLAAFMEASLSIAHGITSRTLKEGAEQLYKRNENKKIGIVDFGQLFDYF